MTTPFSAGASAPITADSKTVRLYFDVAVLYVIPRRPVKGRVSGKQHAAADQAWIEYCGNELAERLHACLPAEFDRISFHRSEQNPVDARLFTLHFTVSICHEFAATDVKLHKKGGFGFRVKAGPLATAQKTIRETLTDRWGSDYHLEDVHLKFAASRDFVFEIHFGGVITIERKITSEDVSAADGVANALEEFFDEVSSTLRDQNFEVSPPITLRRTRNHRYRFEVTATRYFSFDEREVIGDLSLIDRQMKTDELQWIMLDNDDDVLNDYVSNVQSEFHFALSDLPEASKLIDAHIDFADQSDELMDVVDNLVAA